MDSVTGTIGSRASGSHRPSRLAAYFTGPGLVSTNGAASLAAADAARARRFVEALWKLEVPSSPVFRYYDGLLYTMCLLHASGRFRVIPPPR